MTNKNTNIPESSYEGIIKSMRINHPRVSQVADEVRTLIYPWQPRQYFADHRTQWRRENSARRVLGRR